MATNTYVALKTSTVSVATPTVTINSIPSGYTDLILVMSGSTSGSINNTIRVGNGTVDTGSNYSCTILTGNGTSATSTRRNNDTSFQPNYNGYTTTGQSQMIVHFQNYSNTSVYKTMISRSGNAATGVDNVIGLWRSNSAIDTIQLLANGGYNWQIGTTFTIYGVLTAVDSSSTATPPVSGYSLWLDGADDSSFTYSSGTLVSQWSDKSGNARHFTQATTANQPNRISTIRQNNYPVVQFWQGGADTFRWLEKSSYDWAGSANTVFIVMKGNTGTGYYQAAFAAKTSSGLSYAITGAPNYEYAIFKSTISPHPYNLAPTTGTADVAVWKSAGISGGAVTASFYKNGVAASGTQSITGLSTNTTAQLGANNANESLYGYICEVLVYPSQLSDGDRNSVEAYLKSKWGIA